MLASVNLLSGIGTTWYGEGSQPTFARITREEVEAFAFATASWLSGIGIWLVIGWLRRSATAEADISIRSALVVACGWGIVAFVCVAALFSRWHHPIPTMTIDVVGNLHNDGLPGGFSPL